MREGAVPERLKRAATDCRPYNPSLPFGRGTIRPVESLEWHGL